MSERLNFTLQHRNTARDNVHMNEHGFVPIKFYLLKQRANLAHGTKSANPCYK